MSRFPRCGRYIILCAAQLALGCSGRVEETVAYDVFRMPVAGFQKMSFLGVAAPKGMDKRYGDKLIELVQACGQYQKVAPLEKVFSMGGSEGEATHQKLRADLQNFQDGRYVHGVLVVEPILRKVSSVTNEATQIAIKEGVDHAWFDSYGYAASPGSALFGTEEIGPRLKFEPHRVTQRRSTYQLGLRYALYNKRLDTVVLDRKTYIAASLSTFSANPAVKDKTIEDSLMRQLIGRIARAACPKITSVERKLFAAGDDSKADKLIENGVSLVEAKNDWEGAADQWRKAVLVNKRSAYAFHNLGVYYERAGEIPAAMEEFDKAKRAGINMSVAPRQYDASLAIFRPHYDPLSLEPRVHTLSGANWVSILGGRQDLLQPGREFPVYRARRMGEGPEFRVDGVSLVETGRVKIVKLEPPFALGRITHFIDQARMETGDIVVTSAP